MLLKVNMNIKVVTKNFTFLLGILLTFGLGVSAKDIPNIQDTNFPALEYPIRENAFVMMNTPMHSTAATAMNDCILTVNAYGSTTFAIPNPKEKIRKETAV